MSKYWDINKILPYNRCFNFINGERSIGKSYTTQKFIVNRALTRGQEFIYLVRTQDEKRKGIFESAFAKVLQREFPEHEFETTNEDMFKVWEDEDGNKRKDQLGYCIALSEAVKVKKRSFPNVRYIIFDEYMLEAVQNKSYVNGWNEPDLFLSIYHTVDREEDRAICFLLGNNTSFYNPYHMHSAFRIPNIKKGEIWYSDNVLFQWATSTDALREDKLNSKFLKMIESTKYGQYASKGDYIDDNIEFVAPRSDSVHVFSFIFDGVRYGVWTSREDDNIFISHKTDPSCKMLLALTASDHNADSVLVKDKNHPVLKWLARAFKLGFVRYESMEIKKRSEDFIIKIL